MTDDVPLYEVTFVFVDGFPHTMREPKTMEQIDAYRRVLDARLNPPPRGKPDELPLDDDGQPVDVAPVVSFRFDFGDQGMIVPADKILRITWQRT